MQGWPVTGTQPLPPECQVLDPRTGFSRSLWGLLAHLLQAVLVQYTEGTQRLEEPVSKMTVKFCGGEPMDMAPKYSICRQEREGSWVWVLGRGKVPRESSTGPVPWLAQMGS